MDILDIHTHRVPETPGQAIINCNPHEFAPKKGHYYSVGFHPWNLSGSGSEDLNLLATVAKHPQVLALGEAGLDRIKGPELDVQENMFKKQLFLALLLQKPLIIHCVKSYGEILHYKKTLRPDNPWIIHGFRGGKELARQLTDNGIYLSFGEYYQEETLQTTPLDRLFLETDNGETEIQRLYERAAHILSMPVNELTAQVGRNTGVVFGVGGNSL